jgi:hypothetical protein
MSLRHHPLDAGVARLCACRDTDASSTADPVKAGVEQLRRGASTMYTENFWGGAIIMPVAWLSLRMHLGQ